MHPGPLALVVPRLEHRSARDIKEDIYRLEAEKRQLKRERRERKHHDDSEDEVIIERRGSGSRERRGSIKIEKDRKGNMAFVR